jgi:hypothetical protein
MAEGSGTSVGTIYVEVVPRLSPQALAQFNSQLGAAIGGGAAGAASGGAAGAGNARMAAQGAGAAAFDPDGWKSLHPGGWQAVNASNAARATAGGGGGAPPILNGPGMGGGGGSSWQARATTSVPAPIGGPARPGGRGFLSMPSGQNLMMQGMFGGWEVGSAYNAMAQADVIGSRGNAVASMHGYLGAVDKASSGIMGAGIMGMMRFTENNAGLSRAVAWALPGLKLDPTNPLGRFSPRAMEQAVYEAGESVKDDASRMESSISARAMRRSAADTRFEAGTFKTDGSVNREIRAAAGRSLSAMRLREATIDDYGDKMRNAPDGETRNRIKREMESYAASSMEDLKAKGELSNAQIGEIKRLYGQSAAQTRRAGRVLQAEAAGQFGLAERRGFENSLTDARVAADNISPALGVLVGGLNRMAQSGYDARQAYTAGQMGFQANAAGAMYQNYLGDLDAADRLDPLVSGAARDFAGAKYAAGSNEHSQRRFDRFISARNSADALEIAGDRRYSPATAGLMADVRRIQDDASESARITRRTDDATADEILRGGIAALTARKRMIEAGGEGVQIGSGLGLGGGGNGETNALLKAIIEAIKNLGGATVQ